MKNSAFALIARGILAIVVGVIAVAWPSITVGAFVILFAIYAFLAAVMEAARAFQSKTAGSVAFRLLLALISVVAGVVALAWPGITALALVLWVAAWALVSGIVEIILAFSVARFTGDRLLFGLAGLVSVALGVVLAIRPDIGAVTLAQVYGLFSIIFGITSLVMSANTRSTGRPMAGVPR
jgi:uncharacterized membrane protein HdeD (DUF308 family)